MKPSDLGRYRAPGEDEAEARAWPSVRDAFASREPQPRHRARRPVALALATAALVGGALTPAGQAVGGFLRDRIVRDAARPATPAPLAIGTPGRLLLAASAGIWVVRGDGSGRLLGRYTAGTWSARGQFVAVTRDNVLYAAEPETGTIRWPLVRKGAISDVRWSGGDGFRIAYREAGDLRVVNGDGTGDRVLIRHVSPIAPTWRPGPGHVLAYVDRDGDVHEIDVDAGTDRPVGRAIGARVLAYTPDGRSLLTLVGDGLFRLGPSSAALATGVVTLATSAGAPSEVLFLTVDGGVHRLRDGSSTVVATIPGGTDLAWSPDASTIIVADQRAGAWHVIDATSGAVHVIADVAARLDPDRLGSVSFPSIAGWCC